MTAAGHKQTKRYHRAMSALPLQADKAQPCWHVLFVPKADIRIAAKTVAIRSPHPRVAEDVRTGGRVIQTGLRIFLVSQVSSRDEKREQALNRTARHRVGQ